jgi:fucose 4-O-acetylase-like acetyltransferase
MPLFFVLSGLFLWESIARDRIGFLKSRWWQVIYPYLIWSYVTAVIKLNLSIFVNHPISIDQLLLIPLYPVDQYWFLYALLLIQIIMTVLYPRKWLLILAGGLGFLLSHAMGGWWIGATALFYLPLTALGVLLAQRLLATAEKGILGPMLLFAGGWVTFVGLSLYVDPRQSGGMIDLLTACSGSCGTIGLAMVVARAPWAGLLAVLGRASLAIYLTHTLFSAGMRIGLSLIGPAPNTMLSFSLSVLVGLIGPWLIWRWWEKRGAPRLVGFGGPARSGSVKPIEARA